MSARESKSKQNDDQPVPAIRHSADGSLVEYGFEHDGAFHPIAAERAGDYDERVKAAQEES